MDSEIDNAARGLTSGEPGGDLRARVLARIDERPRAKRRTWLAIAAPVAAVAAAVAIGRIHDARVMPTVPIAPAAQRATVNSESPSTPTGAVPRATTPSVSPQIAKATPRPWPTHEHPRASGSAVAAPSPTEAFAAPGVEPIVVEPLMVEAIQQPDAMVFADLEAAPIEVDEIEIATLAQ